MVLLCQTKYFPLVIVYRYIIKSLIIEKTTKGFFQYNKSNNNHSNLAKFIVNSFFWTSVLINFDRSVSKFRCRSHKLNINEIKFSHFLFEFQVAFVFWKHKACLIPSYLLPKFAVGCYIALHKFIGKRAREEIMASSPWGTVRKQIWCQLVKTLCKTNSVWKNRHTDICSMLRCMIYCNYWLNLMNPSE